MPDLLERLRAALADRYAVESEVGRGGMATVFLARDPRHSRDVAIKVLHPELTPFGGSLRFQREIEVVAQLEHPHILPLFDSGDADGLLYFVMPFVRGASLRERIDRERQLPVEEALAITRQVADGLEYAHAQGIVHRDVKPSNIMLSNGHARITDFGVAGTLDREDEPKLTGTGLAVGSPSYMSPEQAAGEAIDGRSDIYSLGCMLYEMLAGEPPFMGKNPQMVFAQRLSQRPASLLLIRDTVPEAIDGVVRTCLAVSAADRYGTAAEVRDLLSVESLVTHQPIVPTESQIELERSRKDVPALVRVGEALAKPIRLPGRRVRRTLGVGLAWWVLFQLVVGTLQDLVTVMPWPVFFAIFAGSTIAVMILTWIAYGRLNE